LSLPPQPESNQQERIYLTTDGITSYHTKRAYDLGFNQFIKITVKNQDLRALLDTKQSVIESKIIDHLTYLKDVQQLAYMSINTRLSGILRFFAMNDYHLNIKKIRRFLPENTSDRADRPYSIPEIQQILTQCDIRSRVIVLIMCTTGCRIDALRELQCGDISKISEYGIYRFWFYNRYRKHRYISYCTKECANAIDAYLSAENLVNK
jgi:integrase